MSRQKENIIRMFILGAGITLCVFGILRGELSGILQKAIVICLECIGIG